MLPVGLVLSVKSGLIAHIPSQDKLKNIRNYEASTIISSDGILLGKYLIYDRTPIQLSELPEHLIHALIATEDSRFYSHRGVDYRSMMRVLVKTIFLGDRSAGGGSTLSQQLAKNLFGRDHNGWFSVPVFKVREMLIAQQLEEIYTKDEILDLYLNTVPFGENVFGIESAAQRFFGKTAARLSIQDGSVLIGMLKATTYYNPRLHSERTQQRRNVVLAQMAKSGFLTSSELDSLCSLPLKLNYRREDQNEGLAPYFREHVRLQLTKILDQVSDSLGQKYNLYVDGLHIYTTIDSRLQQYAEDAMKKHMSNLQKTFDEHWRGRTKPWADNEALMKLVLQQHPGYQRLVRNGADADSLQRYLSRPHPAEVFSWSGTKSVEMSILDSIKFSLGFLNTGILAADPVNGQVKAWVGGINFRHFKYDHVAKSSKRQVGSVFKPIVYATALEQQISPCEYTNAGQEVYVENNIQWSPANADQHYEGKYSFQGALASSVNTVSVKVLERAGLDNTIRLAHNMGISSNIPRVPSIALGTASISLMEMTEAYMAFANGGKHVPLHYITKIEDKNGRIIWQSLTPKVRQVMAGTTSQMMIEMLKNVVNSGTAVRLRTAYSLTNDIAGKTGTTQSNADGWFIAMTPRLVTAVWVGGEYPSIHFRSTQLGQGANTALPIYALFQQHINSDKNLRQIATTRFPEPSRAVALALDCDPFKEDVDFWQALFGRKDEKKTSRKTREQEDKKGAFRGIRKLFGKKN